MTLSAGREKTTSIHGLALLQSSSRFRSRNALCSRGDIGQPRPSRDASEIRRPQYVRRGHADLAVHLVQRVAQLLVGGCRLVWISPENPFNIIHCHRVRCLSAGKAEALAPQVVSDLAHATVPSICIEDTLDLGAQRLFALGPIRGSRRIGALGQMFRAGGRGDRQQVSDRLSRRRCPDVYRYRSRAF